MPHKTLILTIILLLTLLLLIPPVSAATPLTLKYYYAESCSHCREKIPIITAIQHNYSATVTVLMLELTNATNMQDFHSHGFTQYPAVLIQNQTKIISDNITYNTIADILDSYIRNLSSNYTQNETTIFLPLIGRLDLTSLSLPVLTVTLGALDSINPCSFFVLFFLLSLLISLQSRRKMLLVGGIFIFFSGFIYFLFMFLLFNTLAVLQNIRIISLAAGIVALAMGILNIKDFFYFKQGPSLSIPEEKRTVIFDRTRSLVRASYLPAILGGAIFLAVTVNFYELLCTLGFPLVYTTQLAAYHLPTTTHYLYLILYNIVYVIPLIAILLAFTFTLGRAKLSEWRARQLKLLSGIMILSFGILFVADFMVLQNVWAPIGLLIISVATTLVLSYIWKKRMPPAPLMQEHEVTEGGEADSTATTDSEPTNPPAPRPPG